MMEEFDIKLLQKYELDILRYIDKVCRENNIVYYLDYGTLIGAVRHKGFIPWDDDVDISMSRENFNKFLETVTKNPDKRYKLGSIYNEPLWTAPLPKVFDSYTVLKQNGHREKMDLGLYVDIFIMDGYPNNPRARKKFIRKLDFLQKIWCSCEYYYDKPNEMIKKIKNGVSILMSNVIGARKAAKKLCKEASRFSYEESDYVGALEFTDNRTGNMIDKRIFDKTCELEFEGYYFLAPFEYDRYLRQIYGDYMTLPPLEKRKSHHDFSLQINN